MKMESKETATKALEIMKSVLAQTDVDGFEYDSRETFDRFADNLVVKGSEIIDTQSYDFANDLMVKGSAVIAPGNCGLMPDANHIAIPEMFKAVARCFCFDKFTTKVFFDSDYEWESFDIIYEDGELIINSLYHDHDAEPYCEDCDDYYRIIEEDGTEICRCECGHTISVEEYKASCEEHLAYP